MKVDWIGNDDCLHHVIVLGFFLMDSTSEYNMHDSIILKEMSLFSLFGQNHNLGFLRTAQGDL